MNSKELKSQWKELPFPKILEFNKRNNQGILFTSKLYKNQTNCVIFLGEEGFQLLYNEDIKLKNILFEIYLHITRVQGKFQLAVVLESENKKPIKIFYRNLTKEEIFKQEEVLFSEESIIKAIRQETLKMQSLRMKGFYIYPLTKEIVFCIHKIQVKEKPFLLL